MNLQLINGKFSKNEVTELIHKMIQVKIDYHEQKIKHSDSEEDIKFREHKIKSLQNNFKSFRLQVNFPIYEEKIPIRDFFDLNKTITLVEKVFLEELRSSKKTE